MNHVLNDTSIWFPVIWSSGGEKSPIVWSITFVFSSGWQLSLPLPQFFPLAFPFLGPSKVFSLWDQAGLFITLFSPSLILLSFAFENPLLCPTLSTSPTVQPKKLSTFFPQKCTFLNQPQPQCTKRSIRIIQCFFPDNLKVTIQWIRIPYVT